jgi:hypothetical protein
MTFGIGWGFGKRDKIFADLRIKSRYAVVPLTDDQIVP